MIMKYDEYAPVGRQAVYGHNVGGNSRIAHTLAYTNNWVDLCIGLLNASMRFAGQIGKSF